MADNWAIFAEENKAEWSYGNLTDEFIENTVSFLNGLDGMGKELFGSGVASIELDWRRLSKEGIYIRTTEVFVVSLFSQFFLIASDPMTTIKLIEMAGVPSELGDIMRGVLVGQASVIYSNLYMDAVTDDEQQVVDDLFRSTILELGYEGDLDAIVDKGRCSFATFNFSEMLTFHYLLRKIFSRKIERSAPWGIVADSSGSPIHISYGDIEHSTSLAGYLSVLSLFCLELFNAPPKSIVFGGERLIPLEMINGEESFCAFSGWDILFKSANFLSLINNLPQKVNDDLRKYLSKFMAEKLSKIFELELQDWDLLQLIQIYGNFEQNIKNLTKWGKDSTD